MIASKFRPKSRIASKYSKFVNHWTGFLSNRSVVMAQSKPDSASHSASGTFEAAPESATPGLELHRVSFVSAKRTPQTQALLERMIGALGLGLQEVSLVEADVEDFAFRKVGDFKPKSDPALIQVAIVFGKDRAGIYRAEALDIMPTHSLEAILTSPVAKKEAWQDLQHVAKTVGLTLPQGTRS